MSDARSDAVHLLQQSLVRIDAAEGDTGSGFWIGPGLALSCAHVAPRGHVSVTWRGQRLDGHVVEAVPVKRAYADEPWPYPDLALIDVPHAPVHECVWLSDQSIPVRTPLLLLGYSSIYSADLKLHSANGIYAGPHGDDQMWRFIGDEIAPGMSGGPVLDLHRGAVCGVVKTSREVGTDHGGLLVPFRGLRHLTPAARTDLWQAHDRYHARGRWISPRRRLTAAAVPAGQSTLDAGEETELLDLVTRLSGTPDLRTLYADAVAPSSGIPPEEITDIRQLCYLMADLLARPGQPHPLLRAVHLLAEHEAEPVRGSLREWTVRVAARRGEYDDLERWRHQAAQARPRGDQQRPSIIVQVDPTALDRTKFLVTLWAVEDGTRTVKIYCNNGSGNDLPATRALIADLLRPLLKRLQGWAGIEFVLPGDLFDEDFENLLVGRFSRLGRTNPVVIRDLERLSDDETWRSWEDRWRSLHGGAGRTEWIACDDRSTSDQFDASLRMRPDVALLGLAMQPRQYSEDALGVALYAGVPAAMWSRDTCPEHRAGESAQQCSGDQFRSSVSRFLTGRGLDELPDVIQQVRNAVAAGEEPSCANVVLLWDNPRRRPEPDAPLIELT